LAPESQGADRVEWIGWIAVVSTPARLVADRCIICGSSDGVIEVEKTYEVAKITALARRPQRVTYSLCRRCQSRWSTSHKIHLAMVSLGLLLLPTGFSLLGNMVNEDFGVLVGAVVGFLVWMLVLVVSRLVLVFPRQVRVVKVDPGVLSLRFPDATLARELLGQADPDYSENQA